MRPVARGRFLRGSLFPSRSTGSQSRRRRRRHTLARRVTVGREIRPEGLNRRDRHTSAERRRSCPPHTQTLALRRVETYKRVRAYSMRNIAVSPYARVSPSTPPLGANPPTEFRYRATTTMIDNRNARRAVRCTHRHTCRGRAGLCRQSRPRACVRRRLRTAVWRLSYHPYTHTYTHTHKRAHMGQIVHARVIQPSASIAIGTLSAAAVAPFIFKQ